MKFILLCITFFCLTSVASEQKTDRNCEDYAKKEILSIAERGLDLNKNQLTAKLVDKIPYVYKPTKYYSQSGSMNFFDVYKTTGDEVSQEEELAASYSVIIYEYSSQRHCGFSRWTELKEVH